MTRFFKGLFYEERLIRVFFWSSFADRSMTLGPIRYCSLTVVMISMFWGVNCWALSGQTAVSVMSFSYKVSWKFLFITYSWLCSAFHLKSFQTAPLVIVSFPVIYFVRTVLNLGNKFRCIFLWDTARKKKKKRFPNAAQIKKGHTWNRHLCLILRHDDEMWELPLVLPLLPGIAPLLVPVLQPSQDEVSCPDPAKRNIFLWNPLWLP